MSDIDALSISLHELVKNVCGAETVILANQGEAPPKGDYATYNVNPISAYGFPSRTLNLIPAVEPVPDFEWQDAEITLTTTLSFMLSVNLIGTRAKEWALAFPNANFRPSISAFLFAHRIGWRYTGNIRNLTGLDGPTTQSRQQLDVHLWAEVQATETILLAAGYTVALIDENGNKLN